jgi:hypothetical protein
MPPEPRAAAEYRRAARKAAATRRRNRAKRRAAARKAAATRKRNQRRGPRVVTKKNQILGLPSWLVIGGAALGLFLLTRKASAKTAPAGQPGTNMVIMPTGGWAYPPMTPSTFSSWCQANSGVPMGSNQCAISGKGVYTLESGRLKLGGQWVLTDDDLF